MKTTLDLPDELVREMKLRAVMQGRTLEDLATELIRQGLGMVKVEPRTAPTLPLSSMVGIDTNGIPVVRCNISDLLAMPSNETTEADAFLDIPAPRDLAREHIFLNIKKKPLLP